MFFIHEKIFLERKFVIALFLARKEVNCFSQPFILMQKPNKGLMKKARTQGKTNDEVLRQGQRENAFFGLGSTTYSVGVLRSSTPIYPSANEKGKINSNGRGSKFWGQR